MKTETHYIKEVPENPYKSLGADFEKLKELSLTFIK